MKKYKRGANKANISVASARNVVTRNWLPWKYEAYARLLCLIFIRLSCFDSPVNAFEGSSNVAQLVLVITGCAKGLSPTPMKRYADKSTLCRAWYHHKPNSNPSFSLFSPFKTLPSLKGFQKTLPIPGPICANGSLGTCCVSNNHHPGGDRNCQTALWYPPVLILSQ